MAKFLTTLLRCKRNIIRRQFADSKALCKQVTQNDELFSYNVDMTSFVKTDSKTLNDDVREITEGAGYIMFEQLFTEEDIVHARDVVHYYIKHDTQKATHFHGSDDSRPDLQARVWNLLNKGKIFEKMVQHPKVLKTVHCILGDDAQIGSVATNTLFPGATGQEPHLDYPYWDYYEKKHWPVPPKVKDVAFHMNVQATILLDDFTEENGATAVIPGTQVGFLSIWWTLMRPIGTNPAR